MQQLYRRWLSRYRWANMLRAQFLRLYFQYQSRVFPPRVPYSIVENATELADKFVGTNISDMWAVKDATLLGHSRFILKNGFAAYEASFPKLRMKDVFTDYLFQEETLQLMSHRTEREKYYFRKIKPKIQLSGVWLSLLSASSNNWMHWLSESMPRLASTLTECDHVKLGLLVDQQLPENMREILDIFAAGHNRFEVPVHGAVNVEQLIVPTRHTGMSAFWPRHPGAGNGIFYFDRESLRLTRGKIFEHYSYQPRKERKIFILRRSFFRHIANQERIEEFLLMHGFESVSPGEMTVQEQVKLFSEAKIVVAQAGAALANIMFMPEESSVICLSVRNEHVNYDYFRDYANMFNVNLTYVLGELDDPSKYDEAHIGKATHPMNAEFSCPEQELLELLDKLQ